MPAGTVEVGERVEQAVLRESAEETGLTTCTIVKKLGEAETKLPVDQRIIAAPATIYARPDTTSFDWAHIRRGIRVTLTGKTQSGFTQISYTEHDQLSDPHYITFQITGWVYTELLADKQRRHFFLLSYAGDNSVEWEKHTDNHTFTLFWAQLNQLPPIMAPQNAWLTWLQANIYETRS